MGFSRVRMRFDNAEGFDITCEHAQGDTIYVLGQRIKDVIGDKVYSIHASPKAWYKFW